MHSSSFIHCHVRENAKLLWDILGIVLEWDRILSRCGRYVLPTRSNECIRFFCFIQVMLSMNWDKIFGMFRQYVSWRRQMSAFDSVASFRSCKSWNGMLSKSTRLWTLWLWIVARIEMSWGRKSNWVQTVDCNGNYWIWMHSAHSFWFSRFGSMGYPMWHNEKC